MILAVLMLRFVLVLFAALRAALYSRTDLVIENLALRQQLAVLAHTGRRGRLTGADRLFWVTLRRVWTRWSDVLVLVKPETVIQWHRAGFRKYWTWLSRRQRTGRPSINAGLRELILRMAAENPTWGAPRIHGELRMLGIAVSERTVSRYLPRQRPSPGALKRWVQFLRNHREVIAAMDFFTVPTATFRILYVWFAIERGLSSSCARRSLTIPPSDISSSTETRSSVAGWFLQRRQSACARRGPPTEARGRTVSQSAGSGTCEGNCSIMPWSSTSATCAGC